MELDYKALHPTMLYHLSGLDVEGDPYDIPGFSVAFRPTAKAALMALLNSGKSARKLDSIYSLQYPDGWSPKRLLEALKAKHAALNDYFRTDAGIWLQRLDSDIASEVMRSMREKYGALVLPVHDSFIVADHLEVPLHEEMLRAYEKVVGRSGVKLDRNLASGERVLV